MNNRYIDYINNMNDFAVSYIKLMDTIEQLESKASTGCTDSQQELDEIKKEIQFYERCRKDKIFRYIAKY